MDNLGMIEEYTAMNGLGDVPAYLPEEEDLTPSGSARASQIFAASGAVPGWLRAGLLPAPIAPPSAPYVYTAQDISPEGTYDAPANTSAAAITGINGPVAQAAAFKIASNSNNVFTPQVGTVRTDPNRLSIAQVINALLGVTAAGVTEVQRQKLAATLITAQKKKQPVYLPPQVVQKSQVPVGLLVGAGALVAVGVALYFVLRKKS